MIDHSQIPDRYKGWIRINRPDTMILGKFFPGCVQYWHGDLKQSLFFDENAKDFMETGTRDGKMYRIMLLGTWEDFEVCCRRCGIELESTLADKLNSALDASKQTVQNLNQALLDNT